LNHFTATHPRSIFRSLLVAQLLSPERRVALRNRELTVETAGGTVMRTLADAEVLEALRDTFDLQLPPDIVLKIPD